MTYDVARRNGPPFRGRLLQHGEQTGENGKTKWKFAMFEVDVVDRVTVGETDFVSAKPYTGRLFRAD